MEDLNDKINGGTLDASEWNQVPSEIQNVIQDTGQTLTEFDLNQLGKGIAQYAGNGDFYTDSGATDTITLTPVNNKQITTAYVNGLRVRFIKAATDTTGTVEATVNVGGLGVKNIDGSDQFKFAAAQYVQLRFSTSLDKFVNETPATGIINLVEITADTTYNAPAGVKSVEFTCTGGGGGGGGVDGQGAGTAAISDAGSASGTAIVSTSNVAQAFTIVIGAGGTGGAAGNNNGNNGNDTTIVSSTVNVTAIAGLGGLGDVGTGTSSTRGGAAGGGASGGDINLVGGASTRSVKVLGDPASPSVSGGSYWTGGSVGSTVEGVGNNTSVTPGCGGGGAITVDSATNFTGGDGFRGVILVREFF